MGRGRSHNKYKQKRLHSKKQRLKHLPPTCCSSELGATKLLSHTTPRPSLPYCILPFLPHVSTEKVPATLMSPPVPEARPTRTAPAQVCEESLISPTTRPRNWAAGTSDINSCSKISSPLLKISFLFPALLQLQISSVQKNPSYTHNVVTFYGKYKMLQLTAS